MTAYLRDAICLNAVFAGSYQAITNVLLFD
jgi:hypothetical protein